MSGQSRLFRPRQSQKIAAVTVEVDDEKGPVVAVRIDNRVVRVYLSLETASLLSEEGSAGLMVNGDLVQFRTAVRAHVVRELANMYR